MLSDEARIIEDIKKDFICPGGFWQQVMVCVADYMEDISIKRVSAVLLKKRKNALR
jgi:hypothetical protein